MQSVQIIDGDGEFVGGEPLSRYFKEKGFIEKTNAYTVAVFGAQSSGKSTLLNMLFETKFVVMDDTKGRNQTTLGVHAACVSVAERDEGQFAAIEPSDSSSKNDAHLLVLDFEGTDGRERGEDVSFERRLSLFALAIADVLLVNMWMNDIGRYHAANYANLKTVLELNAHLFQRSAQGSTKVLLLFVVRDTNAAQNKSSLAASLLRDVSALWSDISKPDALANSAFTDFFDVRFAFLRSKAYEEDGFKEDVRALRALFRPSVEVGADDPDVAPTSPPLDPKDPQKLLEGSEVAPFVVPREDVSPTQRGLFRACYRKGVPPDGIPRYAKGLWDTIKSSEELDVPKEREMVAMYRCGEIAESLREQADVKVRALAESMGDLEACVSAWMSGSQRRVPAAHADNVSATSSAGGSTGGGDGAAMVGATSSGFSGSSDRVLGRKGRGGSVGGDGSNASGSFRGVSNEPLRKPSLDAAVPGKPSTWSGDWEPISTMEWLAKEIASAGMVVHGLAGDFDRRTVLYRGKPATDAKESLIAAVCDAFSAALQPGLDALCVVLADYAASAGIAKPPAALVRASLRALVRYDAEIVQKPKELLAKKFDEASGDGKAADCDQLVRDACGEAIASARARLEKRLKQNCIKAFASETANRVTFSIAAVLGEKPRANDRNATSTGSAANSQRISWTPVQMAFESALDVTVPPSAHDKTDIAKLDAFWCEETKQAALREMRRRAEVAAHAHCAAQAQLLNQLLRDRFEKQFRPAILSASSAAQIQRFAVVGRRSAAELLDFLAAVRLFDEAAKTAHIEFDEAYEVIVKMPEVPPSEALVSAEMARHAWAVVMAHASGQVELAVTKLNMGTALRVPLWGWGLFLAVAWNEIMYVLTSPLLLLIAIIAIAAFGRSLLATWYLHFLDTGPAWATMPARAVEAQALAAQGIHPPGMENFTTTTNTTTTTAAAKKEPAPVAPLRPSSSAASSASPVAAPSAGALAGIASETSTSRAGADTLRQRERRSAPRDE